MKIIIKYFNKNLLLISNIIKIIIKYSFININYNKNYY